MNHCVELSNIKAVQFDDLTVCGDCFAGVVRNRGFHPDVRLTRLVTRDQNLHQSMTCSCVHCNQLIEPH